MKVGIIGGGAAGLLTTWLLEQSCDVILFEQKDVLGGHARTIYIDLEGKKVPIEIGFEFFNKLMFPNFCKLLKILDIQTEAYPLSFSFFKPENDHAVVLPPIQKKIFWYDFLPSNLLNLIQLKYLMYKSAKIIKDIDTSITLESFLNNLKLTSTFKNDFFLPLFAAGWGAKPQEFKTFAAYNILSWIMKNESMGLKNCKWLEIVDGVSVYINSLGSQINKAKIITSSNILKITYNNNKYIIEQKNNFIHEVDHLIIATNASDAAKLLSNIEHAKPLYNSLNKIEYIDAKVAIHSDIRFMPKYQSEWSISNIIYNGIDSTLTFYKKWKSKKPIFRSWLYPSFFTPENIYAIEDFKHAKPNLDYFKSQKTIENLQGRNNLWLAGLYTHDIDAHESAVVSAIKVAKRLAPDSERLKKLTQ